VAFFIANCFVFSDYGQGCNNMKQLFVGY